MASCKPAPPPALAHVRDALAGVLWEYGKDRLELEFRLGHRSGTSFVPGVSQAGWECLKARLSSGRPDVVVTETTELICDDGKHVTTAGGTFWMHKKRLCHHDIDTHTPWCCRVSMALEVTDPPDRCAAPPPSTTLRRHKQRWSFRYRCWTVDLTRVVSNLPHQLDSDGAGYEVEVELRDTAELFTRTRAELLEWGWSIVRDMCDMMDP